MVTTDLPDMVSYYSAVDYTILMPQLMPHFGIGFDKRLYALTSITTLEPRVPPKTPAQYAQDIKAIPLLSKYNVKAVFIDPSAEGFSPSTSRRHTKNP